MAGIVSCLAFCPVHNDLMAAGTYGRVIGVFDARSQEQQLLLEGHAGGVTQVCLCDCCTLDWRPRRMV